MHASNTYASDWYAYGWYAAQFGSDDGIELTFADSDDVTRFLEDSHAIHG